MIITISKYGKQEAVIAFVMLSIVCVPMFFAGMTFIWLSFFLYLLLGIIVSFLKIRLIFKQNELVIKWLLVTVPLKSLKVNFESFKISINRIEFISIKESVLQIDRELAVEENTLQHLNIWYNSKHYTIGKESNSNEIFDSIKSQLSSRVHCK